MKMKYCKIKLYYGNKIPIAALAKLNNRKHHICPTRELQGLQK